MIDLRSDTVTRPTPEMRRAMAEAEVGDDVYGEDPTVNRLEARAAEVFGKEAALFVPTGTMGNTVALKAHLEHGQEVICESRCHLMNYELSMLAWFSGCLARTIQGDRGILTWDQIKREVRPLGPHWAPTGAISIENTHNMAGGSVTPVAEMNAICDGAHELGLKVHIDGARIFNAATYLGISVAELIAKADTVMFCLSKGLGAPSGSMVVGTKKAMEAARLYRKRLGGGMRQVGILAAAGLIALEKMPTRLAEDHANARYLAEKLSVDIGSVQTNILMFEVKDAKTFSAELKKRGVLANPISATTLRMVTHFDVSRADCEAAAAACAEIRKLE